MANKYLDYSGLSHLWTKIKTYITRYNGNAKIFYGTCASSASETAKVVTCSDFTSSDLVAGAVIYVKFANTNSGAVASLTMNVNSTGAKKIQQIINTSVGNLTAVGQIRANQTYCFCYDGTNWVTILNYNNTYSNMSQTEATTGTATSARSISAKVLNDTIEEHIGDKADKSATVSNVAYNSTNKKITKTINGTTSDVVTVATLKTAMSLSKSDVGLGNVDNTADANKSVNHASTADSATKATQDGNGDVITATYVKNVNASGWIAATGITNIDEFPAESLYGMFWLNCEDSSITGAKPATVGGGILFSLRQSSGICRQFYMGVTSSAKKVRYYNYNTETWTSWSNAS